MGDYPIYDRNNRVDLSIHIENMNQDSLMGGLEVVRCAIEDKN